MCSATNTFDILNQEVATMSNIDIVDKLYEINPVYHMVVLNSLKTQVSTMRYDTIERLFIERLYNTTNNMTSTQFIGINKTYHGSIYEKLKAHYVANKVGTLSTLNLNDLLSTIQSIASTTPSKYINQIDKEVVEKLQDRIVTLLTAITLTPLERRIVMNDTLKPALEQFPQIYINVTKRVNDFNPVRQ